MEIESELPPSQLGTKEYWNTFYENEIKNFEESKDEGEIWFGHTHMMKVVRWVIDCKDITSSSSILDIGCGNGAFLFELADEGYSNLCGVDYSHSGIELAKKVGEDKELDVNFQQIDFLDENYITRLQSSKGLFDVCHDKGTYDAISLRQDDSKISRLKYMESLYQILKLNGLFIITSCNWTIDELKQHFNKGFQFLYHIKAATFKFGGKVGATVSSAVFRKANILNDGE